MLELQNQMRNCEIFVYPLAPKEIFDKLFEMLEAINIPWRSINSGNSITFGMVRQRFTGRIQLSKPSEKYPHILFELCSVADKLGIKENFDAIHINKNVCCPKHKDSKNRGISTIVSFGEYLGSELVVENLHFSTRHRPVQFEGHWLENWNTDDLVGNKYSLVFYKNGKS